MNDIKATLESQLGDAPCLATDTEEMFWLRRNDDRQSMIALANALVSQYRFREAEEEYARSLALKDDDISVLIKLGGTQLTLMKFEESKRSFDAAASLGAPEKSLSIPTGVWHYLRGEYEEAAQCFERSLPCGCETAIAAIYWHTLSCVRAGSEPTLICMYSPDMDVGHHTAYHRAVALFAGDKTVDDVLSEIAGANDLDYVISAYGVFCFKGNDDVSLLKEILTRDPVWPSIAYLCAWSDSKK